MAHGRPDQTWTLERITTLIGRRFHHSYTIQGCGSTAQTVRLVVSGTDAPGDRARPGGGDRMDERDLAVGGSTAAAPRTWIVFENEAGITASRF